LQLAKANKENDDKLLPLGKTGDGLLIGNDIIDWQIAKRQIQNIERRRLEKLFNPTEIEDIINAENQILFYWKLWAAKEAAYKAWQRFTISEPVFNPKYFNCKILSEDKIKVQTSSLKFDINIERKPEYIQAFIEIEEYSNLVFKTTEYQHFISALNEKNWLIEKAQFNIPYIKNKLTEKRFPVSLSHDGRFYALSISKFVIE